MLKKNNAFMEGFRKWGLPDPKEAASSSGETTLETLPRGRGDVLDRRDMWRQDCPESSEWEGELELDSAEEEEGHNTGSADENVGEDLVDNIKQVIESPLWVFVRDFVSSADVL